MGQLIAMQIRWYIAKRITLYSRSRATLDATKSRHWANIHPLLPQRTPWSSILA
jgi:hypothetical protein